MVKKKGKGSGWHGDTPGHKAAAYKRTLGGTSRHPMIRVSNPRYRKDRKFEKAEHARAEDAFNKRMEILLEKYKKEISRRAGTKGFDVFESYGGRDEADMERLVKILAGGQNAYDDYMMELQDYNIDSISEMTRYSIREFLKDEGMEEEEIGGFEYSAQWDEFRFAFEEHLNYNVEVFFDYDVLLREKESYEVGYDGVNNFIDPDIPESIEFQKKSLNYITPKQLETILANSWGGVGYFGIIINAMDILEAIREDKKTVSSSQLVIGVHDALSGSGYYTQVNLPRGESFTMKMDGARLDYGSYSIGDVFGGVDWKWR